MNNHLQAIQPDFSRPDTPRLGLELEMFGYDARNYAPLGLPEARISPADLLERITRVVPAGKIKVDETTGVIIGLELGCGNFSLEPGGQLEYASCPQDTLSGVLADLTEGLRLLEEAAAGDVVFLDHGTNPLAPADLPLLVPKHRYKILNRYFASQPGGRGVHMMRYSATAQPNVDVIGSAAWTDAVNLTLALTPFARALFANSRYFQGRRSGEGSERQRIWAAIDTSRTGIPPGVAFQPDLAERYAEWARNAYVFLAGNLPLEEQPVYGELTFAQWETHGFKGTHPTFSDWETHLGTLFPDLRLRRFLEVRMVDAQPYEHALAPMAFWAEALQVAGTRQRLWRWLETTAQKQGLQGPAEFLTLSSPVFADSSVLESLLVCVEDGARDDLAKRSLGAFRNWLRERAHHAYPETGLEFVKATATAHPSRQLQSLLSV
jgi:glutamate--cysteine ligase